MEEGWKKQLKRATIQSTRRLWGSLYVLPNVQTLVTNYSQLLDDLALWHGEIKKKWVAMQSVHITTFSLPRTATFWRPKPTNMWNKPLLNSSRSLHLHMAVKMRRCEHTFFLLIYFILLFPLKDHTDNFWPPCYPWAVPCLFVWPQQSDWKSSSRRIQALCSEWDPIPCCHCSKS